ncbi:uncharacterized protein LOC118768539 [Octopus sinensis]|uniref:Uncharacterized protein LOC118768539 n=1 Tax=Octopus sinensis TaxID=2607531 RepID=A0A7E6FVA0_9MOLL|nr:uncharacterized protein LOC118768539 [Octopus sinensis]XP_036371118.1 uncharacterized protein LOC118768539 [Octopus sinensis]XP_036371119.1 uncharacterized protein LOC118768539 [Octopus sinensis]
MVPSVLMSQVKRPLNLCGGSIDKIFVYLIDRSRMFAINNHNLLVNDLVTNNQLNYYIDLVDVFSRNISVSEMLSSTLYLQDLTVSDKARHVVVPSGFGDQKPVYIRRLCVIENNLIASYDWNNKNIKIFTFDGQLVDSIKLNVFPINMCRWQRNTLVITTYGAKSQLLTLKVGFPLSSVTYLTRNEYKCIASLSNNQLLCSKYRDKCNLYVIVIDEKHSTVNIIKQIGIPETLTKDRRGLINYICNIIVTANGVIIVSNRRFIIFFNSGGQYLHSVRHYMAYDDIKYNNMTIDDSYLYIYGWWDRYGDFTGYNSLVCLTQTGEYNRIFINSRIYKDKIDFTSINCNGPRFAGSHNKDKLYVEGLFQLNREKFPVCHLQTDECLVQVKDIDISDEGKTVVCEKANNGNVKMFDRDGELLCHRDLGSLVGGVCFTHGRGIMVTVPNRREIFQLKQENLGKYKVWESQVPYGVIWRKVGNIYWCAHIELIECHCIKIDGDQVNILESVSLSNLDSGLRFPSITSETNKEIFSNELINKLEYSGGDEVERGKSGEIIGKSRLKVRCGNYIAESKPGIDEISVRRLPYRTAMVPFSIPTCTEPVNYDIEDSRDYNSKLIKLDENVSVLMFRESVTLIRTTTTVDILQHKQLPQLPLDICWWKEECFIVAFGEELMFFNRDLRRLKTIKTKKFYNRIYKYNDNQLVCGGGGPYIEDMTECRSWSSYYVDVIAIDGKVCKYIHKVCSWLRKKEEIEVVLDIVVTSGGDIVVVKEERERYWSGYAYDVIWFSEHLVRSIKLPRYLYNNIHRHYLTTQGEYVYIVDRYNNIYQIPGHIEHQTSEDIQQYLLLGGIDNEVYKVLGLDVSDNSLMVFGIIPGRQSFAFFYFDK